MIMTFEEYNKYLEDIDDRIKVIGRRISYREIQLIGRPYVSFSPLGGLNTTNKSSEYTEDERQLINGDKVRMALRKESERLANERLHVAMFAEMPLGYDEAVAKVEERTKSDLALAAFFDQLAEKEQRNVEITECCTCDKNKES